MDKNTQDFLQGRTWAIAGVSRSDKKFGTIIYRDLKSRGYKVYGINPFMEQIEGDKCYASMAELPDKVDGVVICLPPNQTVQVIRDAAAAGVRKIWLQQGAESAETDRVARELGVDPVTGKCIMMYAGDVKSIHGVHRFFAKLFGQY